MKKVYFLLFLILGSVGVFGQISLTNGSPTISEIFDGIGTTATATLPASWKASKSTTVRTVTGYAAAVTATEIIAGNSMSATAGNGIYNYGAGVAATATDRAVGGLSSSASSKSVNIFTAMTNNGTTAVTNFTISYKVEKYRNGLNPAGYSIQMYYSSDGTTWTNAGASFLTSLAADADNLGYASAPATTVNISSQTLSTGLNLGSTLYLAWNYSVTTGTTTTNAQGLGIDDVLITANFAAGSSGLSTIIAGTTPAPATISSLINTSGAGSTNFSFQVVDDGSLDDANPTLINQIVINQGTNNSATLANWTQAILGAELSDGVSTVTGTINAANITFASLADILPSDIGYIADNATKNYTLKIWLKTALGGTLPNTIDGKQFEFLIQTSGISTEASGSSAMAASQSQSAGISTNVVTVVASKLLYVQNTTTPTGLNVAMTPAVTVSGNDVNNNRDLDFVESIRVTSTGTLAGTPVDVAAVAGLATFSTLTHTVLGTGLTLNAERTATLDWDITSNPFDILLASNATDYFQSVATGDWTATTTWESSPDNVSWIPATLVPDQNANNIYIRNGHTVTASTNITADQIEIQSGGILLNSAGIFTINDGTGDDVTILGGGIFTLISTTSPVFSAGTPTVNVNGSGILRISRTGYTGNGTGMNSTNYVYQNAAIAEYTLTSAFSSSGVTFFPNAAATIPVFRTTSIIPSVGAGSTTVFNGVFEANGAITFTGAGTKTFRNGIIGTANIVGTASGKFIINGATAILGGTGIVTLPTAGGLEIGTPTTVTMTSAKNLIGDVSLLPSSFVDLGAFDLTVSGVVNGGTATSYIKTSGAGKLILQGLVALKTFPIGNSRYNPVTINNISGYDWSVKVDDFLNVVDPLYVANVAYSVQRTWTITPSLNPPATPADVTFQYDDADLTQIGGSFDPTINVQMWHTNSTLWQTAGFSQIPSGTPVGVRTTALLSWSNFSKFAISNNGFPLPISINYFTGTKNNGNHLLNWKLTCVSSPSATIDMERSIDGRNYSSIYSVYATALRCQQPFNYTDNAPAKAVNYYRLKMTDANGKVTYSSVVSLINAIKGIELMNISPNPIVNSAFNLNISAAAKTQMDLVITDMQGRVMQRQSVPMIAGFNQIPVTVKNLAAGTYQLVGNTADGRTRVLRFVIQ